MSSLCFTITTVGNHAYLHIWFPVTKARGDKFEIITVIRLQKKRIQGCAMILRRKNKRIEAALDYQAGYHNFIYLFHNLIIS